jgi:hypothetical protein
MANYKTASVVVLANATGTQTLTNKTITTPAGLVKGDVGLGNVDNTTDANKPVSTATQTALDLKAPKAAPTFTGTLTAADVTISGNLTVSGTTITVPWTAPLIGSAATSFTVSANTGGLTASQANTSSVTFTLVPEGTTFTFTAKATNANGDSPLVTSNSVTSATYTYAAITSTGNWTSPVGVTSADIMVVAGGGAGGSGNYANNKGAGGGGAGGVKLVYGQAITPSTTYAITVGTGGNANTGSSTGGNGNASTFATNVITAVGGGGGSPSGGSNVNNYVPGNGGSGGGAGAPANTNRAGGTGTANQGFAGGNTTTPYVSPWCGAGGGGAGAVGSNTPTTGFGGNGLASSITGSSVTRAGGGAAGGEAIILGTAGTGGGGNVNSGDGGANLGGGGYTGGYSGGSGVVIVVVG